MTVLAVLKWQTLSRAGTVNSVSESITADSVSRANTAHTLCRLNRLKFSASSLRLLGCRSLVQGVSVISAVCVLI
jgi:hypothetical protein